MLTLKDKPIKVVGVIPARYKSTRFPGKPLADICGKPMIWWVYHQASQVKCFDSIYVATDDNRIQDVCRNYSIPVFMTRSDHPNHMARVWEVSESVSADYYICVNGDEPLISPDSIQTAIPKEKCEDLYFGGLMRELTDPAEVLDPANIKVVVNRFNECMYISRMPMPYPKGTLGFRYLKWVGVECFNKQALDFFVHTPMGVYEKIEDIDHLRFIENKKTLHLTEVASESLSVDTKSDLERVIQIIERRQGIHA